MSDEPSGIRQGRIIRGIAGFYYVETAEGELYACKPKGSFRKDALRPLPGDAVSFIVTHEGDREGSLTEIMPRKNALIRPAVANVDQALIFFSVRNPDPSFLMMDRYLLFLSRLGLPTIICFNKRDLADEETLSACVDTYRGSGHPVLSMSVRTGEGVEELLRLLEGKTTFLAGPSGAGKSSLINRICPAAAAETGELSRKLKRGKNTTRHSELFRVCTGMGEGEASATSWLMDTPGFTALDTGEMNPEEVADCYAEFAPYRNSCRFTSCLHLSEPTCAVRDAAEEGGISAIRYKNYCQLVRDQQEKQAAKYR